MITIVTIKILFTINSLKTPKHHLQFLPLKNPLVFFRKKNSFHLTKIIQIKNISFQLKQFISIKKQKKLFSRSIAFLLR